MTIIEPAQQFTFFFMDEVPVNPAPIRDDLPCADLGVSYAIAAPLPMVLLRDEPAPAPSAWRPMRKSEGCAVCNYPTDSEDGLCSLACRRAAGRRVMLSPTVARSTHVRHIGVSNDGTFIGGGNTGAMRRSFNMDNQKIDFCQLN